MKIIYNPLFYLVFLFSCSISGQNISLYKQYNGKFDFVFFGNTLNQDENGQGGPCVINTSSMATLSLNAGDVVENAYLYWAGSGTGDFDVKLNGIDVTAQRTFSVIQVTSGLPFFSAFADVTTQIKSTGNGVYNLSDLDLTTVISPTEYCNNATNFGGWAIVLVYKNPLLPLNQLGVYDGLQYVPDQIDITLSSLNVIDNMNAKIGFVAWEGDRLLNTNETLRINGNPISNPPLNPVDNAFNGTNSFTGASDLYNMDLDVYDIQNNINIGDATVDIQLTSGRDFVMINAIVTKLNSQLPDATINIDNVKVNCDSRQILVNYNVFNLNSTDVIPSGTKIAVYVNGVYLQSTATVGVIPIDGNEPGQITLTIPAGITSPFDIQFVVDDNGTGTGSVIEIDENNNTDLTTVTLLFSPTFNPVDNLESCNLGLSRGFFNFSNYDELIKTNPSDTVRFFETLIDAQNNVNPILNPSTYTATVTPMVIFVRIDNANCNSITTFLLTTRNCPPLVHDFVSADGDAFNPVFFVEGLRDIFLNFKTSIYNRWGTLVWSGNNSTPDWDGYANKGLLVDNQEIPAGTYYYVIELNDPDYPKPLVGYLYLTR